MTSRGRRLLLLAGALAFSARPASGEESAVPPWLEEVQINGFVSGSYSYNFNRPDSRTNAFRVFDFDDNTFKLDVFELVVQKPAAKPRESGFRTDLELGSSIPVVSAAAGLFRDDAGVAEDIDLQQAFATYVAPLGSGLKLDVGKFVTHCGYEVIEGYDGWNDNASRSLLFGFAIPFTHTGLRASYAFSPKVSALAMVVNGWDNARDNNRAKSVGGQLTLTPDPSASFSVNGMIGPERTGNDSDARSLLDFVAILKPLSRLALGLNLDWGREHDLFGAGGDASWIGGAMYLRLAPSDGFAVSVRGEEFQDQDGFRTGIRQTLHEVTLTPELHVSPRLLLRGDLRIDQSDESVFQKRASFTDSQTTVSFNALYSF